ncbi:hypothetical protein ACGFNU_45820 [Spirillospora sp. NPDC048911]|uniref:hypothetical protein n=1 Tax=Spirillospora sp. NPDC048911 TaxID=3364527 RepID=UPI00371B72D0
MITWRTTPRALVSSALGATLVLASAPAASASAAEPLPQRILVNPVALKNWDADVVVTGKVQRRSGDGWASAPAGQKVTFTWPEGETAATTTVRSDGSFRATFDPGYGNVTARVDASGEYAEGRALVMKWLSRLDIDSKRHDHETNPEYPFRGKKFEVRRVLKARRGEKLPGRKVVLWWAPRPKWGYPKTGWKALGSGTTDRNGRVVIRATAWKDGWLRTTFAGDAHYAPVEDGYPFWSYYQTAITKFNASPEPARKGQFITLSGRLMRWTAASGWRPVKNKHIDANVRVKGTSRWRDAWCYNGGTSTDAKGWFRLGCQATKDASWQAYYVNDYRSPQSGSLDFPAMSAIDYVDVR